MKFKKLISVYSTNVENVYICITNKFQEFRYYSQRALNCAHEFEKFVHRTFTIRLLSIGEVGFTIIRNYVVDVVKVCIFLVHVLINLIGEIRFQVYIRYACTCLFFQSIHRILMRSAVSAFPTIIIYFIVWGLCMLTKKILVPICYLMDLAFRKLKIFLKIIIGFFYKTPVVPPCRMTLARFIDKDLFRVTSILSQRIPNVHMLLAGIPVGRALKDFNNNLSLYLVYKKTLMCMHQELIENSSILTQSHKKSCIEWLDQEKPVAYRLPQKYLFFIVNFNGYIPVSKRLKLLFKKVPGLSTQYFRCLVSLFKESKLLREKIKTMSLHYATIERFFLMTYNQSSKKRYELTRFIREVALPTCFAEEASRDAEFREQFTRQWYRDAIEDHLKNTYGTPIHNEYYPETPDR